MKKVIVIVALLIIIAVVSGPTQALKTAKGLIVGLGEVFAFLAESIVKMLPVIGIEDVIIAFLVFSGILMLLSGFGIYLSRKKKNNLWTIISFVVEVVSTISTIGSAIALKWKF